MTAAKPSSAADYYGRKIDETIARLPGLPIDRSGAVPVDKWPRVVGERVELLVVHWQAAFYTDPVAAGFVAWHVGSWTDFNNGGWIWYGLAGRVCFVRPLLQPEN